jgi:hypothetical protein
VNGVLEITFIMSGETGCEKFLKNIEKYAKGLRADCVCCNGRWSYGSRKRMSRRPVLRRVEG